MNQMSAPSALSLPAPDAVLEQQDRIIDWLCRYIGEVLSVPPESIDVDASFQQIGLDSSAAVGMTGDLGDWLGRELDAAMAYDFISIRALSRALAEEA
jgi:acyl carrier protein